MSAALEVGARFTSRSARRWRDDDGNRHTHTYTLECRVTAFTAVGFTWETLAVLDESNRPELGFTPEKGEMAWFGWEAAMNRGDVEVTR